MSPTLDMLERLAIAMGQDLTVEMVSREIPFDDTQLAANAQAPMAERLQRAISWNRLAGESQRQEQPPVTSGESAPPLDAGELLQALHDHRVDYVVIGGMAMEAHGHVRTTQNLDVVAAWTPLNMRARTGAGAARSRAQGRRRRPSGDRPH